MTLTNEGVGELLSMTIASTPGTRMSKEDIIRHLVAPVCCVKMGVREHVKAIGYTEAWRLCYVLGCHGLESLEKKMWDMVKKRKRKDSTHG